MRIYEVCCAFHPHIACIIALNGERVIYSAPYNTCIYDAFKSKALYGATMFNIVVMHICCRSKALLYDPTAPHKLINRAISRSVNTLCTQRFDRSFQHSCATLGFQITHHTRYGVSGPVAHTMHTNTLTR